MPGDAGRSRGGKIAVAVADEKAAFPVHRPTAQQIDEHPRRRLAPVARPAESRVRRLGVKRAIADVVDMGARARQFRGKVVVEREQFRFRIKPARDPRLVGRDKHEPPGIVERLDRGLRSVDPAEARGRSDKPVIMVEDAVAIEEGRRPPAPLR